ncbi:MAG: hypothetical protein HY889_06225, partial [Deltaproteobacteria bacterium]|nr:hypothetical protein [Deltaproteobacteria bacterium]
MKRYLAIAIAAAMGLVYAGSAHALSNSWTNGTVSSYTGGAAANGIAASRHNLGSFGSFITSTAQNGTTEICVFCHTPHHTNTAVNPAPLWNRGNASAYTAYGTTIGGSNITTVGSVSQACLSCHDGVTTFDNLVNAPGAGGVVAGGASQGWTFADEGGTGGASSMPAFATGAGDERLNIGTTLSNDHPMSVTYNPNVASLRPTNTVIGTINLTTGLQASASTAFNNNLAQNRWAIKGYIDGGTATIADLLRNTKVECSSCHDPHFKNTSWDEIE